MSDYEKAIARVLFLATLVLFVNILHTIAGSMPA